MRRPNQILGLVHAARAACNQHAAVQPAAEFIGSAALQQTVLQPGVDNAMWARQQQAWRFQASPAKLLHDRMAEVADCKLSQAHTAYSALHSQLKDTTPGSEVFQRLMKESATLAPLADGYQQLQQLKRQVDGLHELLKGEGDKELQGMAQEELETLQQQASELQQSLLLSLLPQEPVDDLSAVVLEVRSSVGGNWAGNFAADLLEMYRRYAAAQGWRFELLDSKPTDLGGIKSATALISGHGVFSHLRWESGVHRATMVPPNEKQGRMQTGTAVVVAMPEANEVDVKLSETDLRIETCRASGKGGQHVNTTDSAVRIVHLPTGTVVTCQNERSQLQNRTQALRVLRAKLHKMAQQKQADKMSEQRKAAAGLANPNERIRSYYYEDSRVTDHRVALSVNVDVESFMEGNRLQEIIEAVQQHHRQQQLQQLLEDD